MSKPQMGLKQRIKPNASISKPPVEEKDVKLDKKDNVIADVVESGDEVIVHPHIWYNVSFAFVTLLAIVTRFWMIHHPGEVV
jgi:hypothetical protein